MAKETQSSPVNLYLHGELVKVAKGYAEKNRKTRSLSALVEMLLVRELRAKGLKLPEEFSAKAA